MYKISQNYKLFVFCVIFISFIDLSKYLGTVFWAPTYTLLLLEYVILALYFSYPIIKNEVRNKIKDGNYLFLNAFFLYTLYLAIKSIIEFQGKNELIFILNSIPGILLCTVAYRTSPLYLSYFFNKRIYKFTIIIFLLFLPIWKLPEGSGYLMGLFLIPITFWGEFPKMKRIILFFLVVIISLIGIQYDARSQCIKFALTFILGASLIYAKWIYKWIYKVLGLIFLISPFIFLYLGLFTNFNIFDLSPEGKTSTLTQDTRTIVYEEAITSSINNKSILYGRGFQHGYDSKFQYKREGNIGFGSGTSERKGEAQIVNYYTNGGLLYILLFFLLSASCFIKTFKAQNIYIKAIGLFVTFIWFYSWIEFMTNVNITTLCLWLFYGMCLSPEFIRMNNQEFKNYIKKHL